MDDDDRTEFPIRATFGGLRTLLILTSLALLLSATWLAWRQTPHGDPWNPPRAWTWAWWVSPREDNSLARLNYVDSNLISVFMLPDAQHGWAVGVRGAILTTSDAGQSWRAQASPTSYALNDVQFTDVQHGWAVGDGGTILTTRDGGATWKAQRSTTAKWLISVSAPDSKRAWAVGAEGAILATSDGGDTWQAQLSNTSKNLDGVQFIDAQHGWAVGNDGTILATNNGGQIWQALTSTTSNDIYAVQFIDARHGWVAGKGNAFLATSDGGVTWEPLTTTGGMLFGDITSFHFTDTQHGWIANESGTIYSTSDGGVGGWRNSYSSLHTESDGRVSMWRTSYNSYGDYPSHSKVHSVHFSDAQHGWSVGDGGTILSTSDGGAMWQSQTITSIGALRRVHFTDAQHGWVVGTSGEILATSDGGATWKAQIVKTAAALTGVFFIDVQHGWAVGTDFTILATTDGGATWSVQNSGGNFSYRLFGLNFVDRLHGWVVGDNGTLAATSDGGTTWKLQNSTSYDTLLSVFFIDANFGWAVGGNGIILNTSDGGTTWKAQVSNTHVGLAKVHFTDAHHGWVVGSNSTILATSDGGATWKLQNSLENGSELLGVHFVDAHNGWAVGTNGMIGATGDGGTTWKLQSQRKFNHLFDVFFIDPKRGWAVGSGDTIVDTRDGGATWNNVQLSGEIAARVGKPSKWFFHDSTHALWISSTSRFESRDRGETWSKLGPYRRHLAPWWWSCAALALLLSAGAAKIDPGIIRQHSSIEGALASDHPITTSAQDQLGYARIADGLAGFITNPRTSPPLSISITGPWGQGKSSIMALLQRQLRAWRFPIVWFNAWHHQASEQILASFFAHIRDQAVPAWSSFSGLAFRLRLAGIRVAHRPAVPAFFVLTVIFCASVYVTNPARLAGLVALVEGSWSASKESPLAVATRFAVVGLPSAVMFIYIVRLFKAFGISTRSLITQVTQTLRPGSLTSPPAARYQFASDFREVCAAYGSRRLIVFIDDIDRCEPGVVPSILGLVNFLMTSGDCFVVLGAETVWVQAAVANAYKELASTVSEYSSNKTENTPKEFVSRYLEKLLNLQIPVTASGDNVVKAMLEERKRKIVHRRVGLDYDRLSRWLPKMWPVIVASLLIGGTAWLGERIGAVPPPLAPPPIAVSERDTTAGTVKCTHGVSTADDCPQYPKRDSKTLSNEPPADVLAVSAGEDQSQFPWILVGTAVLLLAALAALASLRLPRYIREDSPNFQKALEVWSDWLSGRHTTPRSFKRFVNKVRFLAMLERGSSAESEGWGHRIRRVWLWIRGASPTPDRPDLLSPAIVAYAATLSRQSQWRCHALLDAFPLDGTNGDLDELRGACNTAHAACFEAEYDDLRKAVQQHRAQPSFYAGNSSAAWLPPPDLQRLIERVVTLDADSQTAVETRSEYIRRDYASDYGPSLETALLADPSLQLPAIAAEAFGVQTLLLDWHGRINRNQWWLGLGILAAPSFVILGASVANLSIKSVWIVLVSIAIVLAYPLTVLLVKRLHDLGAGWRWVLLLLVLHVLFVPLAIVTVVVLGSKRGASGDNGFGNPRVFRWVRSP